MSIQEINQRPGPGVGPSHECAGSTASAGAGRLTPKHLRERQANNKDEVNFC